MTIEKDTSLKYSSSGGDIRTVKNCKLTLDKTNHYWLWCETLQHNLAYKAKTKEDALLLAIDSLLFTIHLKDEQLKALNRINDLALLFANEIKPDKVDDS